MPWREDQRTNPLRTAARVPDLATNLARPLGVVAPGGLGPPSVPIATSPTFPRKRVAALAANPAAGALIALAAQIASIVGPADPTPLPLVANLATRGSARRSVAALALVGNATTNRVDPTAPATEVRLDVTGKSVPTNEPPAAIPVALPVAAPLTRVAIVTPAVPMTPAVALAVLVTPEPAVAPVAPATPDPTAALAAAT